MRDKCLEGFGPVGTNGPPKPDLRKESADKAASDLVAAMVEAIHARREHAAAKVRMDAAGAKVAYCSRELDKAVERCVEAGA